MNLVFYGRYSDSGQSEQSIEGQRKVCYEFAERNGYRIIAEYLDRATSGTEAENRPEFQRMIADSAKLLMEGVLESMAEYFSSELSQKVVWGMALIASKCEFTGSGVPLGYKIIDKKFAINEEEAPIVQ